MPVKPAAHNSGDIRFVPEYDWGWRHSTRNGAFLDVGDQAEMRQQRLRRTIAVTPGPADRVESIDGASADSSPISLLMDLFDCHGDVARFETRSNTFFLFSHPSHVREVLARPHYVRSRLIKSILGEGLLAADGPYWERQRRLMLPEFQTRRVEGMVDLFARVASARASAWSTEVDANGCINLAREMDRIALSNIGQALFSVDLDDRFLDAFGFVMREIGAVGNSAVFGETLIRQADANRRFQEAMHVVEDAVRWVMESEPGEGSLQANLLRVLRSARHGENNAPLSDSQIRDEILTMLTAGHETTAVTLSWAWHAIASHPNVSERFYREVDEVLGQRAVVAADLPRLKYTRMIVDETLRLYPPVWLIARVALADDQLGGYEIPAMSGVLISPFVTHRHPEFWPDPEGFAPERFNGQAEKQDSYSYFPFLAGRHLCIGKQFALTETVAVLATIAQQYRFRLTSDGIVPFEPLISLRMRGGLTVALEPRRPGGSRS